MRGSVLVPVSAARPDRLAATCTNACHSASLRNPDVLSEHESVSGGAVAVANRGPPDLGTAGHRCPQAAQSWGHSRRHQTSGGPNVCRVRPVGIPIRNDPRLGAGGTALPGQATRLHGRTPVRPSRVPPGHGSDDGGCSSWSPWWSSRSGEAPLTVAARFGRRRAATRRSPGRTQPPRRHRRNRRHRRSGRAPPHRRPLGRRRRRHRARPVAPAAADPVRAPPWRSWPGCR